jgi:hypothetical protein
VGPGWFLAVWSPNGPASTALFLIDPAGGRYLVEAIPANSATPVLEAWSGDGQHALLHSPSVIFQGASTLGVLDLGTLVTTQVGFQNMFARFTAPDGQAIIAMVDNPLAPQPLLERISLSGGLELSYPTSYAGGTSFNTGVLYSPDGTELAVGASTGIELMSNEGQGQRFLPINSSVQLCRPVRWWTPEELLAECSHYGLSEQLFLVPTSGATVTVLTASPTAPQDGGDLDALQLPSGTYVTDLAAWPGCGTSYVASLQPDGLTAPVAIPGVPPGDGATIVGAQGDRLAIASGPPGPYCSQVTTTLQWFDPSTNSVTPLLGGTASSGQVPVPSSLLGTGTIDDVVMFGEPVSLP